MKCLYLINFEPKKYFEISRINNEDSVSKTSYRPYEIWMSIFEFFGEQKEASQNQKDSANERECLVCLPYGILTYVTEIYLQSFYLTLIALT